MIKKNQNGKWSEDVNCVLSTVQGQWASWSPGWGAFGGDW